MCADWIPGVSQLKYLIQIAFGDEKGARRTLKNFFNQCPVVSQVKSVVEAFCGNPKAAWKTQIECVHNVLGIMDSAPGVGHVKGLIHYSFGDEEGGDNAMKAASRTTGVLAGAGGGFVVGGPVGAVAGGYAGAIIMDVVTTGIDSAVHGEYRPSGYFHLAKILAEDPWDVGNWFDAAIMVTGDWTTWHEHED